MTDQHKPGKTPIVRGARACTTCRNAKMKCIGADEERHIPCERCQRTDVECRFEKHRRGRKPGSKLSEASKMLRKLEKGLNNAKARPLQNDTAQVPPYNAMLQNSPFHPPVYPTDFTRPSSSSMGVDDDDDGDRSGENTFPAQLIRKETERNSFFKTILNPVDSEPHSPHQPSSASNTSQASPSPARSLASSSHHDDSGYRIFPDIKDPIAAGLIDEDEANKLFDMFFLRLNPLISLFDPALHTVNYVRSRCPFLFTTMIMACCKYFNKDNYKRMQRLAHQFATVAFAENWKRVEVVQAFACLTYWKEPGEERTWTYIGYACRMAVELGLNKYVPQPHNESEFQFRERRNRERTYLVLFVHDRSLSTQTGKPFMLTEDDDFIRNANTWHRQGGDFIMPEDVIVASFVQLRLIVAHITKEAYVPGTCDFNLFRICDDRLSAWMNHWPTELKNVDTATDIHHAFIRFFWHYVRLFLNSLFLTARSNDTFLQALEACYHSGLEHLRGILQFDSMGMLQYGQESITVMTAYCAVKLINLLRHRSTMDHLPPTARDEIYACIGKVADTYAPYGDPSSSNWASYHSRWLKCLLDNDRYRSEQMSTYSISMSSGQTDGGSASPIDMQGITTSIPEYTPSPVASSSGQQSSYQFPSETSPTSSRHSASALLPHSETHGVPVETGAGYPPLTSASEPSLRHDLVNDANRINGVNAVTAYGTYAAPGASGPSQSRVHVGSPFYHPQQQQQSYSRPIPSPQSDSEAYYFQNMFKQLDMPHGFDSIYQNSHAFVDGYNLGGPQASSSQHHGMACYANGHGHVASGYPAQYPPPQQQQYPLPLY